MRLYTAELALVTAGITVNSESTGLVMVDGAAVLPFLDMARLVDLEAPACTELYPEVVDGRVYTADIIRANPRTGRVNAPGVAYQDGDLVYARRWETEVLTNDAIVLWRLPLTWNVPTRGPAVCTGRIREIRKGIGFGAVLVHLPLNSMMLVSEKRGTGQMTLSWDGGRVRVES